MEHRSYFDFADPRALAAEYPIGAAFETFARTISRDALRAAQETRFQRLLDRAAQMRFYQRLWGAHGVERGDVRSLDDLAKLPTFEKADIVASIEEAPPFGDFAGLESYADHERPPVIFHTTSGTTGRPQPLLFGPKTREVQNLLLGRAYRFQGLRADDVAHSVYGHGMINGGHYVREAVTHWTAATFMSAGTGIETRSVQQVALMRDFGATALLGFADFIKRLAEVAREEGITIGEDIRIRMISGQFGRDDKAAVSALWGGAACYDWYGVGDTGIIAAEGPDQAGLYVFEDAHFVEICDIDTGAPVADGEAGDMIVTCLFKDDVYPIIRFNTHDVSRVLTTASPLGFQLRRLEGFLGRSDNMVKLRGINVFPQAVGPILAAHAAFAGEFVCRVVRDGTGRDELIVTAEASVRDEATQSAFAALLRQGLGVEALVELAGRGETAPLTQIETRQKPIRLIDERKR
ncbi:MAG: phenylacetate--CoA ligase family protein [Alphaproteobacteria bacterium]|nr:phenylacetate--CoA ligase family protein [Alphaproteobacteria bacterium]